MKRMPEALPTSQNTDQNCAENTAKGITLYQKCLDCPDYGTICNGPKLSALGDIMSVRDFHRAIRDRREIPMKLLYLAAEPVSESTINDYFSRSAKDFKWTTVGCIDNALTAICGSRVGQPPLDNPCPASSREIHQQIGEAEAKLREMEAECLRLQEKLTDNKGKHIEQMDSTRRDMQKNIDYLKGLVEYLKDTAQKRYDLILARDKRISAMNILIAVLTVLAVIFGAGLLTYVIWDIANPQTGLFRIGT